jgi:protease IV
MMKNNYFVIVSGLSALFLLLHLSGRPLFAAENPFTIPERGSASHSAGPFGQTINPVFADLQTTPLLAYQYTFYDGRKSGDHFIQAGYFGFTFLYGWFQDIYLKNINNIDHAGASYCSFTKGVMIKNIFGFGMSYSFSKSSVRSFKGYHGLDIGLLLRPWRYISFGFVMDDAWGIVNSNKLRWRQIYSISIRPYWERFTLSLDVVHEKGGRASNLNYRVTADLRLWYDISLFVTGDRNLDFLFGMSFPLYFHTYPSAGIAPHYYRTMNSGSAPDRNSIGVSIPLVANGSALTLPGRPRYLKIVVDGTMNEIEKRSFWGKEATVFYDVAAAIDRAGSDAALDGIIIRIDSAGIGFGQIQELRQGLKQARSRGKKVYAILSGPGNREYYLASAADRIFFTPNSPFHITGLKAQVYFFKGLMDKVGVQFESVKRGTYKSFNEAFTREHMSEAFRENITSLLADLNGQYVSDIMADRGISREVIDDIFNRGSLEPNDAVSKRFIDEIGYPDDAVERIGNRIAMVSLSTYMKEERMDHRWCMAPKIAIIVIEGSIVSGGSFETGWFRSIGDASYRKALEEAFRDDAVRAVVVRVNSGGGSAAASDYMWDALVRMKKKYRKPVVFSFGNIAASGGYYVACTGDRIFSDRGTTTGSIGVVFGKITLEDLYRKLGISKDIIKMSEFADIFSESRHLTEKEMKLLQKGIDFTYDRFTGKVMEARRISVADISRVAEGRVFTGQQALDRGLADETGGIIAAVEYARHLANIDERFEIEKFPDERGPLFELFKLPEFKLLAEHVRGLLQSTEYLRLKDEQALYLFPYRVEIE